jgi:HEAT repeat protein/nucleoside phosphorylase
MHQAGEDEVDRLTFAQLIEQLSVLHPCTWSIIGGPGAGKTTAIEQMAISLVKNDVLCIVLNSRVLRHKELNGVSIKKFAQSERPSEIDLPLWRSRVKHSKIVFLVDGLNELEREFSGTPTWTFVRKLIDGGHEFPVMTTSRYDVDDLGLANLRDIVHLTLSPLDESAIEKYISARGGLEGDTIAAIKASGMVGVASNPFMLSLLTDWLLGTQSNEKRQIPRSRAELLLETVMQAKLQNRLSVLEKAAERQGLGMESTLCAAAIAAITSPARDPNFSTADLEALLGRVWTEHDVVARVTKAFIDTQMVLPAIQGQEAEDLYTLIHPAFIDFGLALGWRLTNLPTMAWDPDLMEQCVGDWVGLQSNPDSAVRELLARDQMYLRPGLLVDILLANRGVLSSEMQTLAWRRLGRCFEGVRATRDSLAVALNQLPASLIAEGVQQGLLRTLSNNNLALADKVLFALRNGSLNAESLQRMRRVESRKINETPLKKTRVALDESIFSERLEELQSGATPYLRRHAASWLGFNGTPQEIPHLSTVMRSDRDISVRGAAATALGNVGSSEAVSALVKALSTDVADNVRGSAANALGRIGSPDALLALITALSTDVGKNVRGSAANALGRIGSPDALLALITALSTDTDSRARGSAADALGHIGSSEAVPALVKALSADTAAAVRGSAANALGRIGSPDALLALITALSTDAADSVRGSAANALGRIGSAKALENLRIAIENPEEEYSVRRGAVGAITGINIHDPEWLLAVADRVRSAVPEARAFRGAIVNFVARRPITGETRQWLEEIARWDPDPINRTTAIDGLSRDQQITSDLIRFTIAPTTPRPDKRAHDTDNGVLGVTASSVVRMAAYDLDTALGLLDQVTDLAVNEKTWSSTIQSVISQIRYLPLSTAERVIERMRAHAGDRLSGNKFFESAFIDEIALLKRRQLAASDLESLASSPEKTLSSFRQARRSRFEVAASSQVSKSVNVALVTAVSTETRSLYDALRDRGVRTQEVQRAGRLYDMFELPASDQQQPVRVVVTQATDKGGQSSSAVTHALLEEFRPELVFLVGVCAGFGERGVSLFDVILARQVFNYDPEKITPSQDGQRPRIYSTDEYLMRLATNLDNKRALEPALDGGRLFVKDFASGEKVVAWREAELRRQLLDLSVDVYGVETEAHGVMHAIWETFKAEKFVNGAMLKCVSDLGDEDMTVDKAQKQEKAAYRAANVALDIIAAFRRMS